MGKAKKSAKSRTKCWLGSRERENPDSLQCGRHPTWWWEWRATQHPLQTFFIPPMYNTGILWARSVTSSPNSAVCKIWRSFSQSFSKAHCERRWASWKRSLNFHRRYRNLTFQPCPFQISDSSHPQFCNFFYFPTHCACMLNEKSNNSNDKKWKLEKFCWWL